MIRALSFALLAAVFISSSPQHALALTADLEASSDTYVGFTWWNNPDTYTVEPQNDGINHSAEYDFRTGYHGQEFRGLLRFDLSSLPSDAVINSATLQLRPVGSSSTMSDPAPKFYLHKINNDWDQSSVVFDGTNGGANNIYHTYIDWDRNSWAYGINNDFYDPTILASHQLGELNELINLDITSLAQEWLLTGENHGVILTPERWFGSVSFGSSEYSLLTGEENNQPLLKLDYSSNPVVTPEPASMILFGIGGAAMAFVRRRKE